MAERDEPKNNESTTAADGTSPDRGRTASGGKDTTRHELGNSASGDVRRKYFEGAFPASTQVQVAALGTPDIKIEIEAIAVLPD